ncbi:hypothetical protein C2S51_015579 [Perilla frutescens var. frutescens]|nr:hypothetical protein C2S51_015579 [Perilla frutescens var. frutescens]
MKSDLCTRDFHGFVKPSARCTSAAVEELNSGTQRAVDPSGRWSSAIKSLHSIFFKSLPEVLISISSSPTIPSSLCIDTNSIHMMLLFSSTRQLIVRFGGSIDAASLLEFVDSGHDLILVADASASELIREIAIECGVDFDECSFSHVTWENVLIFYCVWILGPSSYGD